MFETPLVALTYLEFHLVFVVPPLLILAATTRWTDRRYALPGGLGILTVVAVLYTTPWDNHLIAVGVWDYPAEAVVARVWQAPVEEYLFFALQPLLTGLWLARLETRSAREFGIPLGYRIGGALAGLAVALAGWLLLAEPTYYLGALFLWAGPVLAIQWGFAWPVLWERRRTLALGIGVPTVYLWVADRIAIELGIWVFDPQYMTGIELLGLPIEEALFFALTNAFLVQGLVLFWWVTDRWATVRETWPRPTTG